MPSFTPTARTAPWTLCVRYHECDPQSVVFNANYYAWADMGALEFWRAVLGRYENVLAAGVDMTVVASAAQFHAPATYDDLLQLETGVSRVGGTSYELKTSITRGETPIADVSVTYVFVDPDGGSKMEPPASIRALLVDTAAPA